MRCLCTRSRSYHCKVVLLDEQELLQEIQDTSIGQHILDTVFRHLNLIETAYFGLRYVDCNNQTHWLDPTKKVAKQLKGKDSFTLYFGVKFYAADPCKLVEEITRYQFFLQIKQDILQGRLPVSFDLAAELGAYAVQSELGDYDPRRHSKGYVTEFRFISNQTAELENKISELHKDLQGQLPAVAELNYLDKVKWLEMYGVDLHPVIGEDNVEYFLGLTPTGVIVLRNKNKVANYYWPTITKIYFKGKYFMLRVCDKNNEENTYGFETPSRPACKHLYKCCMEHHSFFRLVNVASNPPDVVNTRFSGSRTDKLSVRSSQISMRNPPSFTRTPSRRYQRRIVEGAQDSPKIDEKNINFKENATEVSNNITGSTTVVNSFYMNRSDSPRSTRSAPWGTPWSGTAQQTRTYSSHSPRSVRSAGPGPPLRLSHARRSSSVESQSSNDSRPCRRHKHRSKRGSDNESDMSKCSSHGNSRRHRHRSRRSSGSEHEHHHSSSRYQLVESQSQWKEVQRRQAEGSSGVHQANVVRPRSGYLNSGIETESEVSSCHHHHRRKHRKHRSRSRSPSDGGGSGSKTRLPEELKKHLEFQLVDTEGMSEDQLREIPYTIVKTNSAKAVRVRLSPSDRPKPHHAARRTKSCLQKDGLPESASADSPPPPYSESPVLSDLSNKTTTSTSTTAGTTISSNNSSNNKQNSSQLSRLPTAAQSSSAFSNASHSINQNNSTSACSSALYGNPSTLLTYPAVSGGIGQHQQQSSCALSRKTNNTVVDNNNWLNDAPDLTAHAASLVGLPPQPHHSRRNYSSTASSHSDTTLNSTRSHTNSRSWTSQEIRGGVGLPWTSITEQLQTTAAQEVGGNIYSCLDSNPPRRSSASGIVSNFGNERNSINQNILEHRSTTTSAAGGNALNYHGHNNSNNNVIGPRNMLPSSNNSNNTINNNNNHQSRLSLEIEKSKKSALAETGVLGSHSRTSIGGTKAWPNDKQLGWQPKNVHHHQFKNPIRSSGCSATTTAAAGISYNKWNDTNNNSNLEDEHKASSDVTSSWLNSTGAGIATEHQYGDISNNNNGGITWHSTEKGPLIYSPLVKMKNNKSTSCSTSRSHNWELDVTDATTFTEYHTDNNSSSSNNNNNNNFTVNSSKSSVPTSQNSGNVRIAGSINKPTAAKNASTDIDVNMNIERLIQDMTTEL